MTDATINVYSEPSPLMARGGGGGGSSANHLLDDDSGLTLTDETDIELEYD